MIVANIAPRIPPVKKEVKFSFEMVFVLFAEALVKLLAVLFSKLRNFDLAAPKELKLN